MYPEDIGLYGEAAYVCREMVEISTSRQVFRLAALALVTCGERAMALRLALDCVRASPDDSDRHRSLDDVRFELGRYSRAAQAYCRAFEPGAADPGLPLARARCHALLGDDGAAGGRRARALDASAG